MFNTQNVSPDSSRHSCLTQLHDTHALPFLYAKARIPPEGPLAPRWMVQILNLNKQGRVDKDSITLKAITFCPFCGQMLVPGPEAEPIGEQLAVEEVKPQPAAVEEAGATEPETSEPGEEGAP